MEFGPDCTMLVSSTVPWPTVDSHARFHQQFTGAFVDIVRRTLRMPKQFFAKVSQLLINSVLAYC